MVENLYLLLNNVQWYFCLKNLCFCSICDGILFYLFQFFKFEVVVIEFLFFYVDVNVFFWIDLIVGFLVLAFLLQVDLVDFYFWYDIYICYKLGKIFIFDVQVFFVVVVIVIKVQLVKQFVVVENIMGKQFSD